MARSNRLLAALLCLALMPCAWGCSADSTISVDGGEAGAAPEEVAAESLSASSRTVALTSDAANQWLLAGGSLVGVSDEAAALSGIPEDAEKLGPCASLNTDDLLALEPELVVTSEGVSVNAAALAALESKGVPVMDLSVHGLADYEQNMTALVEITGEDELFERNVTSVVERSNDVIAHAPEGREGSFAVLRVSSLEMTLVGPEDSASATIGDLGLTCAVAQETPVSADNVAGKVSELAPDWLFVVYVQQGKSAQEAFAAVSGSGAWQELEVVRQGRAVVLPQDIFGHAPCARWAEAYAYLSQVLHGAWA